MLFYKVDTFSIAPGVKMILTLKLYELDNLHKMLGSVGVADLVFRLQGILPWHPAVVGQGILLKSPLPLLCKWGFSNFRQIMSYCGNRQCFVNNFVGHTYP